MQYWSVFIYMLTVNKLVKKKNQRGLHLILTYCIQKEESYF